MKALFLLDPAMEKIGQDQWHTQLIGRLCQALPSKIFYSDLEYPHASGYEVACWRAQVDEEYQQAFRQELEAVASIDVVITNSPNPLVRMIFPCVMNLGVGLYSRGNGFPVSYSLDPWGLYQRSLIFNAPMLGLQDHDQAMRYRHGIQNQPWVIHDRPVFAFNSEYWPWQIQDLALDQVQYFWDFYSRYPDLVWTSKPGYHNGVHRHDFDYDYLRDLPSEQRTWSDTSLLIRHARCVWASHSTLGLQAALWGVPIESPSLFRSWTGDQVGTIGALLGLTWFHDLGEFMDRLERLMVLCRDTQLRARIGL